MKLSELIIKVKEQNLSKDQLEDYETQISNLYVQMQMELAELEKEEALFLNQENEDSEATRKRKFKATLSGQRLIVLKRYSLACKEMLRSLKTRLFKVY